MWTCRSSRTNITNLPNREAMRKTLDRWIKYRNISLSTSTCIDTHPDVMANRVICNMIEWLYDCDVIWETHKCYQRLITKWDISNYDLENSDHLRIFEDSGHMTMKSLRTLNIPGRLKGKRPFSQTTKNPKICHTVHFVAHFWNGFV